MLLRLQPTTIHTPKVEVHIPWPCVTKPHDTPFYVTIHDAHCPHGQAVRNCRSCQCDYQKVLRVLPQSQRCSKWCACCRILTEESMQDIPHLLWHNADAHVVSSFLCEPVVDVRDANLDHVGALRAACSTDYPKPWLMRILGRPVDITPFWYEMRKPVHIQDTTWRLMDRRSGAPAALSCYASYFLGHIQNLCSASARKDVSECPHSKPKVKRHLRKR